MKPVKVAIPELVPRTINCLVWNVPSVFAVESPARVADPPILTDPSLKSPPINMVEPAPILNSPLALSPPARSTLHPMTTLLLPAATL